MPTNLSRRARVITRLAAAALTLAALPAGTAHADGPIGLYLGGAVGQSRVDADGSSFNSASFKENHSAFKAIAGIRPIPVVGAELEYLDFGHPKGTLGGAPADVTLKGAAAFGVGYMPFPMGAIFVKAGLARLDSTVNGATAIPPGQGTCVNTGCPLFRLSRTDTRFAAGGGVQLKLAGWAVRAEYERFDAAGGSPGLVSLGLTWSFL